MAEDFSNKINLKNSPETERKTIQILLSLKEAIAKEIKSQIPPAEKIDWHKPQNNIILIY
jgi:hypothetical protein